MTAMKGLDTACKMNGPGADDIGFKIDPVK